MLIMTAAGLALVTRVASAEVSGARIFHSCDGSGGCSVQHMDLYDKSEVDTRLADARGAVAALEARLTELARKVQDQQREIDGLKKKLEGR
jgi:hypothetical protein